MKEACKKKIRGSILLLLSFVFCFATSCKDDNDDEGGKGYDSSKPVTFERFSPESGTSGDHFFVYGDNFGNDKSRVKLTINGQDALVINVNNTCIYGKVPVRAGEGTVKVTIGGEGETPTEYSFEKPFEYKGIMRVSTLCGYVDRDGNSSRKDGTLAEAQFQAPYWLAMDSNKDLWLIEEYNSIRRISIKNDAVTTLMGTGGDMGRPRTLAFSLDSDTLFIANDADGHGSMAVARSYRADGFKDWSSMIRSGWCNGASIHPKTGDLFFNSFEQGQLYKWDYALNEKKELFKIDDVRWEFNIQFAPSGKFAYLVVKNQQYILKSYFDEDRRELKLANIFCGKKGSADFADGVGTKARFNQPHEGCFDEDDNFYICDVDNHCIRKISPDGVVSTFAGRPREAGYADGDLRKEAQFRNPSGIVYDKDSKTFYIADMGNKRIRTIRVE